MYGSKSRRRIVAPLIFEYPNCLPVIRLNPAHIAFTTAEIENENITKMIGLDPYQEIARDLIVLGQIAFYQLAVSSSRQVNHAVTPWI